MFARPARSPEMPQPSTEGPPSRRADVAALPARAELVDLIDGDHRVGGPRPDDRLERDSQGVVLSAPVSVGACSVVLDGRAEEEPAVADVGLHVLPY